MNSLCAMICGIGLLLGERIAQKRGPQTSAALQTIFSRAIAALGVLGLGLLLLVLSSALLASWKMVLALLLIVVAIAMLLWRGLIRIYSRAQVALKDTLAEAPAPSSMNST